MSAPDWQRAASFAARAHRSQLRKDGSTPYSAHPFRVAMTVRHVFGCDDEVCLCAALLHDVIEDCDIDHDDLLEEFGAEVADCVSALSKDMRLREDLREPAYDEQLAGADWRARLIKLADTFDNLSDLSSPSALPKMIARCERAITLGRIDAADHACVAQAIDALEALIDAARGNRA